MPMIEVDDDTHHRLFRHSLGFDDRPNDVIKRMLDRFEAAEEQGHMYVESSQRGYIRRGERTPQPAFHAPILLALDSLGGEGSTQHVLDVVGRAMKDKLTAAD